MVHLNVLRWLRATGVALVASLLDHVVDGRLAVTGIEQLVLVILVLRVVQQRRECVALVVLRRPPEEHDHDEDGAEEDVPERGVHPA